MAKFDRRSCRIYDGVRDSKIHWDIISDFDRKIDSSNYGRVFPRSFKGDDFTEYNNKGFHHQSFLDSFTQHCEEDEDPFHGFNHKRSGTVSSNEEIESWFCDYMKKEAPSLGVYRRNTESESIIIRFKRNLPVFDGFWQSEDLLSWIDAIEDFFEETDPPEKVKCNIVWSKMRGRAYYWWKLLQDDRKSAGDEEISSWAVMKKLIISRFAPYTCLIKVPSENVVYDNEIMNGQQVGEVIQGANNILVAENCEEESDDDDLEEGFVEEHSEKIVELKPAACSTKVRYESDIDTDEEEEYKADCLVSNALTVKSASSYNLLPIYDPDPQVDVSVTTCVGFSKALNISDHIWNDLFYEFGRVGCKHFDPGGIRQDMMIWVSLAKFSHGPVKIVEMEQEEIIMPEGFDPNSMGLEHIAFDISHEQLHIEAQGVTAELKFEVDHEDTYMIRAMNIGPQLMSIKLPDSKTLMLRSLANSLIGIRSFILVDEMLTLSFDPGGITKSGVLCPIRVHECRTNHALPRICDWSFDPGGQGQSRTNICRVLGCVMQAEQIFKGVSVVKLSLNSFSLCICLRESGVFNCMHISARQKLMNVDSQLDNSSNHINGLDVATEGSIVGWEPNVYGTNKQFLLSKYFPKVHILTMRFLFDPGGSAESHDLVDHLSSSSDRPLLKSDKSKDEIGGPYSEKATCGLEVLYPNYMVHIFSSLGLAPVLSFCTYKPIYKREVWIQHCLYSMKSAISALFVRCLSMTHIEAVISDKKLLAYTLEHVSRIWRADYTVNHILRCVLDMTEE